MQESTGRKALTDRRYSLLTPLVLLALLASIVVAVPVAAAQTAGLDQYQPNPGGIGHHGGSGGAGAGGGGGSGGGPTAAAGPESAGGSTGGSSGGGGGGGAGRAGGANGGGDTSVPTSAGTAEHPLGTIPFTDYPMTPLLLGVILLLVAGLIARLATYLAGRRRQPPTPA